MNKNLKVFGIIAILAISAFVFNGLYNRSNKSSKTSTNNKAIESTKSYVNRGAGMNPTLVDGQKITGKVLVAEKIQRGDIIVFKSPVTGIERMVKRVVGLPGDTVNVENGVVLVTRADGSMYKPALPSSRGSMLKVSKLVTTGSFFVVGDNLSNSLDSRTDTFGLIPFSSLQSIVVL